MGSIRKGVAALGAYLKFHRRRILRFSCFLAVTLFLIGVFTFALGEVGLRVKIWAQYGSRVAKYNQPRRYHEGLELPSMYVATNHSLEYLLRPNQARKIICAFRGGAWKPAVDRNHPEGWYGLEADELVPLTDYVGSNLVFRSSLKGGLHDYHIITDQRPTEDWVYSYGSDSNALRTGLSGIREASKRTVFLGDSYTFGWCVDDDETFAAVCERTLVDAGLDVDIVALAVPGYSTALEAVLLESKIGSLKPERVVLNYVSNDPCPQSTVPRWPRRLYQHAPINSWLLEHLKSPGNWVIERSASLVNWLEYNLAIVGVVEGGSWTITGRFRSALFQLESPERVWANQMERYLGENRAALDRVRAICDSRDAELIVALHPDYVTSQLAVAAARKFLREWTGDNQIRFLDLTQAAGFAGRKFEEFAVIPDVEHHPNAEANKIIGVELARILMSK